MANGKNRSCDRPDGTAGRAAVTVVDGRVPFGHTAAARRLSMARWVLVAAVALCGSCAVPSVYMVSRTAEHTPCAASEIVIASPAPPQGNGTFDWVAMCRGVRVACRHTIVDHAAVIECAPEGGASFPPGPSDAPAAPAPAAEAPVPAPVPPPPAVAAPPPPLLPVDDAPPPAGAVARDEVMAALASIAPRLRACVPAGSSAPLAASISMVVGSDGSLAFLGTDPEAPPEVADCLGAALDTVSVRPTTAEPFNFVSDPVPLR
jgi:hypothetical protein